MKTAKETILEISKSIDSILLSFNFNMVNSNEVFEEYFHKITYYNSSVIIEFSASFHPHDYPYYLSIIFKHDERFNPGFISLQELINCLDINAQEEILFPINNQSQIELSTSLLKELLINILQSQKYVQCIK
ncbi:MAG: hypothetical protein KJZ56_11355 [Flavobacteriales bacterium]|nr:hypothetical protein [Flavobacteriales bacterium]